MSFPKTKNPDELAEQAVEETGFDLRSGRIVNPEQFRKWKQQAANAGAGAGGPTNASLMEVFRKARTALQNWVDGEVCRPLLLRADLEAVLNHSEVADLLRPYAVYGPAMREKLLSHLAFLAENRRKFYLAHPAG